MLSLIASILPSVFGVIDKAVTDKDKAAEIKASVQMQMMSNQSEEMKQAAAVIIAEAQGSDYQRNWRPTLMYLIMFLLVFNGVAVPLINAIWGIQLPILDAWKAIPSELWTVLQIGIGGYIAGRSGEKIASSLGGK